MLLAHLHIPGHEQGVRTALCPFQPGLLTQLCSVFLGEKALTFFGKEKGLLLFIFSSFLPSCEIQQGCIARIDVETDNKLSEFQEAEHCLFDLGPHCIIFGTVI